MLIYLIYRRGGGEGRERGEERERRERSASDASNSYYKLNDHSNHFTSHKLTLFPTKDTKIIRICTRACTCVHICMCAIRSDQE